LFITLAFHERQSKEAYPWGGKLTAAKTLTFKLLARALIIDS
jgi:hypothetical protein